MELNKFGRRYFEKEYKNSQLNAGQVWTNIISQKDMDEYAPFTHLIVENNDTACTIQIGLNSSVDGTTISGGKTFYLPPQSVLEIEPKDNILFHWLVIKNLDSTNNIAANQIVVIVKNDTERLFSYR